MIARGHLLGDPARVADGQAADDVGACQRRQIRGSAGPVPGSGDHAHLRQHDHEQGGDGTQSDDDDGRASAVMVAPACRRHGPGTVSIRAVAVAAGTTDNIASTKSGPPDVTSTVTQPPSR